MTIPSDNDEKGRFNNADLAAFKEWLSKFPVPCVRCKNSYITTQEIIESAELTGDPIKPFRLRQQQTYSCTNPQCQATFTYSDSAFVETFLLKYKRNRQ
jgi:hypothetical protein